MSDNLRALHDRRRSLEFQAVALKARIEEIGSLIAILEAEPAPRRPGRPRPITVINLPQRVEGALHEPESAA